jgi:hypothetical protein
VSSFSEKTITVFCYKNIISVTTQSPDAKILCLFQPVFRCFLLTFFPLLSTGVVLEWKKNLVDCGLVGFVGLTVVVVVDASVAEITSNQRLKP